MPINFKIEELLKSKGKTIYFLAKETGITYKTIHKICKNQTTSIQFDILEKICKVLDCELTDIIELKAKKKAGE